MRRRAGHCLGVLAALSAGCTFDDGGGFATLRQVSLEVAFEPGVRAFEGRVLTDQGYRFHVSEFALRSEFLSLVARASSAGPAVFDPADPPPGYGACHGDHCHADDGRLVSYAEIEAQVAAAGAGLKAVARFPIHQSMDLLAPSTLTLREADPSNELPRSQIRQVSLEVSAVELRGSCSGGPSALEDVPFAVELAGSTRFTGPLVLDISRDGPEALALNVVAVVGGSLFDGPDWAALVSEDALLVNDPESSVGRALSRALSANELKVVTTEGEP